ncbi:hypothetical protein BJX61DRAFT_107434 [Aspergillus egyptiacus]|nr:hypothetical protein BJX61DRAFT_107434 [Aspergillus egyptiacus]
MAEAIPDTRSFSASAFTSTLSLIRFSFSIGLLVPSFRRFSVVPLSSSFSFSWFCLLSYLAQRVVHVESCRPR